MILPESEYRGWDAVTMSRLVRDGEVSAAELEATARALAERYQALNAVADVAGRVAGGGAGPLAGVPAAVKELLAWPGLPWAMGSRLTASMVAPGESPYAARLRESGLRVLFSATSSEFGLLGSTESVLRGPTLSPWGAGLSAGGSSGGSAVLVAAGIVPVAHGNDAGGSLRVPAALGGVLGFKPSNGRCVPAGPDGPGLMGLVVEHVLTRSVRDSAQVLAVTERAGTDSTYPPLGLVAGPARPRLRVGVLRRTLLGAEPQPAVARVLERTAELLAGLGHHVEQAGPTGVDGEAVSRGFFTGAALTVAEAARMAAPLLGRAPGPDELEPFTLELLAWAHELEPDAAAGSERALVAAGQTYLRLFDRHDVVLSPTLARTSWPLGHLGPGEGREVLVRRTEEAVGYTPVHNAAGCPAASVPLGQDAGLPVGMHLAAAPGEDARLLALAYELEQAAPWAGRTPDLGWLEAS